MKEKDQELLWQMRVELLKRRGKEIEDEGKKEKKWGEWMKRYGE